MDDGLLDNLRKDIATLNERLHRINKTIEATEKKMTDLESEASNALQGNVKATTAVDALESLKKGDIGDTQCPFCMDTLGSSVRRLYFTC